MRRGMARQIGGKWVYESLAEIIEPRRTALVVVDMQNDYCSPQGIVARDGTRDLSLIRSSVEPQLRLVQKAREVGALVVLIKNTIEPGCASDSPAWLYFKLHGVSGCPRGSLKGVDPECTIEGTWGHEVIDELKDLSVQAPVVRKSRSSAFVNTNLPSLLRSNSIETVIVTGVVTEGCVASTARDAQETDHYVVVPRDCVGSFSGDLHGAALKVLASRCDVTDSEQILAVWHEMRGPAAARTTS
jgi:nicotinamidase-related amidase